MGFWKNKKVLVTGGAGFIGSHLTEKLVQEGAIVKVADSLENSSLDNLKSCLNKIELLKLDLRDMKACCDAVRNADIVMHLAAKIGGVGFNVKHQGTMFTANVLLNTNVMEAARLEGVKKYLCISSACVYPRYCTIPTPEEEGFKDDPEPTNFGYGWSKRIAEIQAKAYEQEFGMRIVIIRPYNSYGPRDHFQLDKAHVIPALINKVASGVDPLVVWGDGEQSRSFVYVTDIVNGMMLALEKGVYGKVFNIGTQEEIKIKDLASLIIKLFGSKIKVKFDLKHLGGQPRRNADISKAKKILGYYPRVSLEDGLKETIRWYKQKLNYEKTMRQKETKS